MEKKKDIWQLRGDITFQLARTAPDALRGKFPTEHLVWDMMNECDELIIKLIVDKILTKMEIIKIIIDFDSFINIVCEYLDGETQIRLAMYWSLVLNEVKRKCEEEDQFEACHNIKLFIDEYLGTAENDLDMND